VSWFRLKYGDFLNSRMYFAYFGKTVYLAPISTKMCVHLEYRTSFTSSFYCKSRGVKGVVCLYCPVTHNSIVRASKFSPWYSQPTWETATHNQQYASQTLRGDYGDESNFVILHGDTFSGMVPMLP